EIGNIGLGRRTAEIRCIGLGKYLVVCLLNARIFRAEPLGERRDAVQVQTIMSIRFDRYQLRVLPVQFASRNRASQEVEWDVWVVRIRISVYCQAHGCSFPYPASGRLPEAAHDISLTEESRM